MKENAVHQVIERRAAPHNRNIRSDEVIRLTGVNAESKCPHPLRRIIVWDEDNQREIVLLTNHLEFGATTIAEIYRERWQIELFFKALKQNLKVKSFVGVSKNALHIQIWTALIAMLLIKWLHHLSKAAWSLSVLASMLRMNLFTYRDLMDWLDAPMNTPHPCCLFQNNSNLTSANLDRHDAMIQGNLNLKNVNPNRKGLIICGF
jgi:transposase